MPYQLLMDVIIKGEDVFGITVDDDSSLPAFGERFTVRVETLRPEKTTLTDCVPSANTPGRSFRIWQKWKSLMLPIVGNDVVDLTDPGNIGKGGEARFIERVLTPLEQKHILTSAAMDLALWSLWAGKEAAYKVIAKIHPDAVSIPKRYEVFLENLNTGWTRDGIVSTPHGRIDIRVSAAEKYLHCLAVSPQSGSLDHLIWSVQPLPPAREGVTVNPSLSVRKAVSRHLSTILHVSSADIEIRRGHPTSGCSAPVVYCQGTRAMIDLSISHDGAFIAYAFSLSRQ